MRSKLDQEQLDHIWNLRQSGKTLGEIAEIIGVSRQNIGLILKREEHERFPELYFKSDNNFRKKKDQYKLVVYPNIAEWMRIHNITFKGMYYYGGLTDKRMKHRIRNILTGKYKRWRMYDLDFMTRITGMSESEIWFRPKDEEEEAND